jgi:hypothetical protein
MDTKRYTPKKQLLSEDKSCCTGASHWEEGDQQVLSQAAAMLVAFTALVTANLNPVAALLALLESLAITGTALTSLLELGSSLISRALVHIVLNGATIEFLLRLGRRLVVREASGRRGKAADEGSPGSSALGHPASTVADGQGGGTLTFPKSGGDRGHIGIRVGDGLASSHSMVGVESTGKQRVRAHPSVGLTAGQGRRCRRHRRTILSQWPRGLLHFLKRMKEISKSGPWKVVLPSGRSCTERS